tara:strand:- start:224 stop:712 length:489 start_codon:yes stop_codon:yes gene_type:complete
MRKYMKIPKGFQEIPRAADNYVVSASGFVFNLKTGRLLKQHWNGYNTYTVIRDKEGRQFRFCFEKMHRQNYTPLTKEWVLKEDKAKIIPDYPDYAVSSYGAVYIINPRKTGPRAREVHMISERFKQGHPYVSLVDPQTKKPRDVRLDKLTKQIWGDESTYEC